MNNINIPEEVVQALGAVDKYAHEVLDHVYADRDFSHDMALFNIGVLMVGGLDQIRPILFRVTEENERHAVVKMLTGVKVAAAILNTMRSNPLYDSSMLLDQIHSMLDLKGEEEDDDEADGVQDGR